jgi:hypothetical protein
VTAGTLSQHAVAAEAIARGDLLFALYSGDAPPGRHASLWLVPDCDESGEIASGWQREAAAIAAQVTGVRCRCSVVSVYPLDAAALGRIAGMHIWSERQLTRRLDAGERLHALVVRAWAAPEGPPAEAGGAPGYPADDDLLPALTDSAFELLVARLEEALSGTAGAPAAAPARAAS